MEWFGLEGTLKVILVPPPDLGRATCHQTTLFQPVLGHFQREESVERKALLDCKGHKTFQSGKSFSKWKIKFFQAGCRAKYSWFSCVSIGMPAGTTRSCTTDNKSAPPCVLQWNGGKIAQKDVRLVFVPVLDTNSSLCLLPKSPNLGFCSQTRYDPHSASPLSAVWNSDSLTAV